MEGLLARYLAAPDAGLELEAKFGTKGRPLSRDAYDRVVERLLSLGFLKSTSQDLLRVIPLGEDMPRYEALGSAAIREYCRNDSPNLSIGSLEWKRRVDDAKPAEFPEFGFRVALASETPVPEEEAGPIVARWPDLKKIFRLGKRISLTSERFPCKVDLTVVKTNAAKGLIPTRGFVESKTTGALPSFEIEIEVLRARAADGPQGEIMKQMRAVITYALQGIQATNFPVSRTRQAEAAGAYMSMLGIKSTATLRPRYFAGPSSVTLQMRNVAPPNPDADIPSVRQNYAVTDKADGERKLMLVLDDGAVFLVDTNMRFQFTGARASDPSLRSSLFDGEHILRDKTGGWLNLYAGFDCYIVGGKDVRGRPFSGDTGRRALLVQALKRAGFVKEDGSTPAPLRVSAKSFYASESIFDACRYLDRQLKDSSVPYETDGIIFTPTDLPLGSPTADGKHSTTKVTWEQSFKWKPPEQNTIDFLVTFVRGADGRPAISTKFQSGTDTSAQSQITRYQATQLRVGYDEERHGTLDPCRAVRDGTAPRPNKGYRPVVFVPTNPYDANAGKCNLLLSGANDVPRAVTGDVIEDNSIVEMAYLPDREVGWRWEPLRVRHDKTAELRTGGRNYGNAYHVANSNWHSLHNPVELAMLTGSIPVPNELGDSDIYYNSQGRGMATKAMRNFHNLYVKQAVVGAIAGQGDSLVDLAVGKGGDIPKWISSKLGFVFGMDVSRDNIHNGRDGICARYLNYRKKFRQIPTAIFAQGDAGRNVASGDAFATPEGADTIRVLMGRADASGKNVGRVAVANRGIARDGFGGTSIQFAFHYLCENTATVAACLRNVSELTRIGGRFGVTCFDGKAVFRLLRSRKKGESVGLKGPDGKRMWSITKAYDAKSFPGSVASLGLAVDVYQDSINQTIREYLVNFDYLAELLETFGFVPITQEEAAQAGLPAPSAGFSALFKQLGAAPNTQKYGRARDMTEEEKQISFLNRYALFRKARDVDAKAAEARLTQPTQLAPDAQDVAGTTEEA